MWTSFLNEFNAICENSLRFYIFWKQKYILHLPNSLGSEQLNLEINFEFEVYYKLAFSFETEF